MALGLMMGVSGMAVASGLPLSKEMQKQYQTKYNKELQCQATKIEDVDYCLSTLKSEKVENTTYMVIVGHPFYNGELSQSHADVAMVSYATVSGNVATVSSFLPNGSMGEPSVNWKLLTLANNEKVWQTAMTDSHQGYSGTRIQMIDASGKDMFDRQAISFDELGACSDKKCARNATSIEGTFNLNAQGLPVIALKGKVKGKKYSKEFTLSLDKDTHTFIFPKEYPIANVDF